MKIVIISDIHGNYDALQALPEAYDELWVLGDLLNYGPQPWEVVADIMNKASIVIRGNHDDAIVSPGPAAWKPRWRVTSEATMQFTLLALTDEQKAYIQKLPLQSKVEREGTTFFLTHATPSDALYGHHRPDSEDWARELQAASADVLLVGHSHVPFMRQIGDGVVLNPGSIGQPRNGDPRASYAVWEGGKVSLKTYSYPLEETIRKIQAIGYSPEVEKDLAAILRTGQI